MVRTRLALAWLVAALLAAAAILALHARTPRAPARPAVVAVAALARPTAPTGRTAPTGPTAPVASPTAAAAPDPSTALTPRGPVTRSWLAIEGLPDPPGPDGVLAILAALDRARAGAYADPLDGDPDAWDARSCPCRDVDVRRLRDLARHHLALRGTVVTVRSVSVARAGPGFVEVVVADSLAPYAAVDPAGRAIHRWPASGSERWRITLLRTSGRWLVGALARAP